MREFSGRVILLAMKTNVPPATRAKLFMGAALAIMVRDYEDGRGSRPTEEEWIAFCREGFKLASSFASGLRAAIAAYPEGQYSPGEAPAPKEGH